MDDTTLLLQPTLYLTGGDKKNIVIIFFIVQGIQYINAIQPVITL